MANQYFSCAVDAWRDGRTLYGRMHYWRTDGLTYTYTDTSFPTPTLNLGGTVFYDDDFANRVHNGINIGDVYSTTFSRTVAGGGDRTVTWSAGSGLRSDFQGSWSATVWFPEPYSPPSTPSISVSATSSTSVVVTYGTSSFGNPSSGTVYLYGGTSSTPTTQIASKTSTGNSTYNHTGLTANTQYYYRARAYNGNQWSGYSGTASVTTPGIGPADLAVDINTVNPTSASFDVFISSYGVPASEPGRYIEAGILSTNDYYGTPRRWKKLEEVESGTITVDNNSSGTLTITPNSEYYYGAYATNTVAISDIVMTTFVTPCEPATVTISNVTETTVDVTVAVQADGGFYRKQIEYSVDDGANWIYLTGFYTGDAGSKTKTVRNLIPGRTYTLRTMVMTDAGITENTPVTFTTVPVVSNSHIYGSANGESKLIQKLYCSVNGETKSVKKLYGSVNGESTVIYEDAT